MLSEMDYKKRENVMLDMLACKKNKKLTFTLFRRFTRTHQEMR